MIHQVLNLIGVYLAVIGAWRLATATQRKPVGNFNDKIEEENAYKPLTDLIAPHKVVVWAYRTLRSFSQNGQMTDSVILHKQFNWGMLWLLLGMLVQYISGFFPAYVS